MGLTDKEREHQRTYYQRHKAEKAERTRRWQQANPDKVKAAVRKGATKNRERERARDRRRQAEHPEVTAAKCGLRRASKLRATPRWVDRKALAAVYAEAKRLGQTVDHIIPLRHPLVCGLHVPWNLQVLPATVNSSKGNRFVPHG